MSARVLVFALVLVVAFALAVTLMAPATGGPQRSCPSDPAQGPCL
jgi:hypothetical protein